MNKTLVRMLLALVIGGLAGMGAACLLITALGTTSSAFQPNGPIDFTALLKGEIIYTAAAGIAVAAVASVRESWRRGNGRRR